MVRLWPVPPTGSDDLIDLAARTAGRNLSEREWSQYFPSGEHPSDPARATFPGLPAGAIDAADAPEDESRAPRPATTSPDLAPLPPSSDATQRVSGIGRNS